MSSKVSSESIKRISAAYTEMALNGREMVTCRQILQENLPSFIKDHLLSLARKKLKTEKPISWNFQANIDFDDNEVKSAFEQLLPALIKSVRLQKREIISGIQTSVELRIDLLVQCRLAIESHYFKDNEPVDGTTLARSIKKIGTGIPYFLRLAEKIDQQNSASISRFNFNILARDLIKNIYSDPEQQSLLQEFNLLLNLYQIDESLYQKGIETPIVEAFLASRELQDARRVVRKKASQGKSHWVLEDIKDIFTFVLKTTEVELDDDETVLEEQSTLPKIIYSDDDKQLIIKKQKIEKQPPGPYPSLFSILEKRDYKVFVKKLFKKDERAFINFMDQVDSVERWRKAKQIIDWELEKRRLDPYSKEALKLSDVVFAKFFHKGRYN